MSCALVVQPGGKVLKLAHIALRVERSRMRFLPNRDDKN
jgi:hypothetical protein